MEVGGAGAVPLEGAPCPCKRRPAPCIDPRDREAAYFLNGDPSQIENRNVISWPTLSDFTSNTNRSLSGTRTNAATSSGISLLANGTFYVFERSSPRRSPLSPADDGRWFRNRKMAALCRRVR